MHTSDSPPKIPLGQRRQPRAWKPWPGQPNEPGDAKRLQAAVVGMGAIAPDRSIGRYALELIRRPGAEATDLVAVLPGAIAVAPDPETVDSLLVVYGNALRETSGCGEALGAYQAGLRRTKLASLRGRAEEGVAACSLWMGLRSEAMGEPDNAALWFAAAIRIDSSTTVGRRALVGYGDARLRWATLLEVRWRFKLLSPTEPSPTLFS